MSEMGEAVTTLPPREATLRIWVLANLPVGRERGEGGGGGGGGMGTD